MTEGQEKREFAMALGALGIATGREVDGPTVDVYWQFLRDLEISAFRAAVTMAGRKLKFFPKLAELRDFVEAPTRITAAMEWANVRRTMDMLDIYGSPDFGPLANAVLHALGGWKVLCEKSIPDLVWYQKDFERIYADFASKDLSRLRSDGHIGEFRRAPEWCALPGVPKPPKQLESSERNAASEHIRKLADSKSIPGEMTEDEMRADAIKRLTERQQDAGGQS